MLLKLFKFNSPLFASSAGFMYNSWLLFQYYYFVITLILMLVYLLGLTKMRPYLDLFFIVVVLLTATSGCEAAGGRRSVVGVIDAPRGMRVFAVWWARN